MRHESEFEFVGTGLVSILAMFLAWPGVANDFLTHAQEKKSTEKMSAGKIEILIKQLGSAKFVERDAAAKALLLAGEDALLSLKRAFKDPDTETVMRAQSLYKQITESFPIEVKVRRATNFGIDVLVERIVRKRKQVTDEDWQLLAEVIDTLRNEGKAKGAGLVDNRSIRDVYLKRPLEVVTDFKEGQFSGVGNLRLIAENIEIKGHIAQSLVAISGKLKSPIGVIGSVIFANGDLYCGTLISDSVVICDASIDTKHAWRSIIVAREKITIRSATATKDNVVEDFYRTGFSNIRFFSIRDLGIQLAGGGRSGHGSVGVIRVEPGSMLDKGGLKVGDVIASVNGEKLTECEAARKLFRRAVVEGNIVIERLGNSTLKIDVP